jgi:hypothetical protein
MSITTELNKPEYQGITNAERLALLLSKTEPTVGRIEQGQLKVLEALIAKGLWRDKMDKLKAEGVATLADSAATAEQKQLANIKLQVVSGFHEAISETKLANKAPAARGGHSVNMNDPMVQQTFAAAQMPGVQLITAEEAAKVIELATFQRQLYPEATLKNIVAHFQPELIDGEWHEIEATKAQILKFKLNSRPPEMTHIIVESQDMTETWGFAATIHSIQNVNPLPYIGVVPYFGEARKLRWKCEYKLDGEMEAVHFEEPI